MSKYENKDDKQTSLWLLVWNLTASQHYQGHVEPVFLHLK